MSPWKNILFLVLVLIAYGLAGHLDYQDEVAMEQAMRDSPTDGCSSLASPLPLDRHAPSAGYPLPGDVGIARAFSIAVCAIAEHGEEPSCITH